MHCFMVKIHLFYLLGVDFLDVIWDLMILKDF